MKVRIINPLILTVSLVLLIGCAGTSGIKGTELAGVKIQALETNQFQLIAPSTTEGETNWKSMAEKLCGPYSVFSREKTSVKILCSNDVFKHNPNTGEASFTKGNASEYSLRAVLDGGGAPIDVREFHDTIPKTKLLFYKRGDHAIPCLFTYDKGRDVYVYQAWGQWPLDKFNQIKNTSKYQKDCKEWYSNELAQRAIKLREQNRFDDYVAELRKTESVNPLGSLALSELARFYATTTDSTHIDPAKAVGLAEKAVSSERNPETLDTLAIAYAEIGKFDMAVETGQQALALVKDEDKRREIEQHVKLFQAGKAYSKMKKEDWADFYYNDGISLASKGEYRKSSAAFAKSTTYIPLFKDARNLQQKYETMADQGDAQTHYDEGVRLKNSQKFESAAAEFEKAESYVKSFKDAAKLAEECRNAMPSEEELKQAVSRALGSQVPVSWVGNLMGGKNPELFDIQVVRIGIYNESRKYWPMQIRCVGSCELNDPFNQGKRVGFDKVGDFILYRDDYGDWNAALKGGMFQ